MSATIDDVAEKAGVSKATVSRVFNNSATVSPTTRKRVIAAMEKLEYTPNLHARKLAGGSGAIALVLQESVKNFFANPFWCDVIDGFVSTSASQQLHPVLLFHSKEEGHLELINTLTLGNYDAVAFFGWHEDIAQLERDIPEGMRVVFGGRQGDSRRFTYVGANNLHGAELATSHLIDRGCRRIITITGDLDIESGRERLKGYKTALTNASLPFSQELVLQADYTDIGARKALQDFLKRNIPFDGIFAANDLMAIEALKILSDFEIRVPNQVKIIGFDDIPQAALTNPPLSTIHQPSYQLGQKVAEQLLQSHSIELATIELPLSVIARASTT
jgi:DNA-binding LacI/PurR family transcriptional regulator